MRDLLNIVPYLFWVGLAVAATWTWTGLHCRRIRDSAYYHGFECGYLAGQRDGRLKERAMRTVLPYRIDRPED